MRSRSTLVFRGSRCVAGFTLIELLTVIAIIGILAAILIPTVGSARISAKRARTKVQFSQWANAMEQFRQEYGYYPAIDGGTGKVNAALFAGALTGKALDGSALTEISALAGNTKRLSFYAIAESELNATRTGLVDAFGNDDIAVIYDRDGDGRITTADGAIVAVTGFESGTALTPTTDEVNLNAGIRAGVIFYSAGNGAVPGDVVLSWK